MHESATPFDAAEQLDNERKRRFKPYPEYRDSGCEWLGRVPEHWQIPPLYAAYGVELGKMLDAKRITGEHLLPYVRNIDVQWDRVNIDDLPEMDIRHGEYDRFTMKDGDLLVCEGGEVGRTAIWKAQPKPYAYQKAIHRLRPRSIAAQHPRFFYYVMRFAASTGIFIAEGNPNTIPHLTAEKLRLYRFAFPPKDEQRAIAAFLDRETARIDELITKKQRLIDLLVEKRTALISHAVTKGLNPSAPMKDSGNRWLGEMPSHWKAVQLRRVLRSIEQGWSPSCIGYPASIEEWGVLKAGAVNSGRLNENDNKLLPPDLQPEPSLEVRAGDVLMSRACGTPSLVGSVAFVDACRPRLLLCDKLFRLHTEQQVSAEFIALSLGSTASRAQIEGSINGAEGLANNITQATVRSLWVGMPPLDEQHRICKEVRIRLSRLGELRSRFNAAIDYLQEYRSALISAAVTGKIDVRSESTS